MSYVETEISNNIWTNMSTLICKLQQEKNRLKKIKKPQHHSVLGNNIYWSILVY